MLPKQKGTDMRNMVGRRLLAAFGIPAVALIAALTPAVNAAALGSPPLVIPAGATATFSNIAFGACNSLSWGYQLDAGPNQVQATFPGGCGTGTAPNVTIGPFSAATPVRVFLTDNHCSATYYSDGTPVDHVVVSGSNPYLMRFADSGGFCERTIIPLGNFSGYNFTVTLTISDPSISATAAAIHATEGRLFTGSVATFSDPDTSATATEYAATIEWGDGTSASTGVVSGPTGGPFTVSGSHTYAEDGTFKVTVTITDRDKSSNTATANSMASVADAALTAAPACATTSMLSYHGPTATFTDAATPSGTLSDFSATIDWGDGTTSAGTVSGLNGGPYAVSGSHTYAALGGHTITTTINDIGGSTAATSCATVAFAFAAGGSFVLGDQSATGSVLFWGARWAKDNSLSGGAAPVSFKGFEDGVATPACASGWTTDPGNSSGPPASVPPFMALIVSSSIDKSGSTISGNTAHMVVVQTDPGYASNPGHPGTGKVVAVIC